MKNVEILALHLNAGGVEKFICDVANALCENNNVTIVSTYKIVDNAFFKLDERVKVKYLTNVVPNKKEFYDSLKNKNILKVLKEGFKAIDILWKKRSSLINYLKNVDCDVIITTRIEQSSFVEKYCNKRVVKIATEHNHHNNNEKYINKLISATKEFDKLVLLTEELTKFYSERLNNYNVECINIKHYVKAGERISEPGSEVISVGRLSVEKGFDTLLEIAKLRKDIIFNIVGDGNQRGELEQIIIDSELSNVRLHGTKTQQEIIEIYKRSFAYLMTSYSESFGIVLVEAMSYGLPCIAFDSAKGACEVIDDGKNGFLVEDRNIKKYCQAIDLVRINYQKLSTCSYKTIEYYDYKTFFRKWNDLINCS